MQEQDPDGAAPQQPGEAADHGAGQGDAEPEWSGEAEQDPEDERAIDPVHHRIGEKIGRVLLALRLGRLDDEPADVRVQQTPEAPLQPVP